MTKKLKKPIAFLTVFAMLLSVLLYFPEGTFGGLGLSVRAGAEIAPEPPTSGTGEYDNPYIITTKEELYWFASQTNKHAKLGNDIEVNADVLDSNGDLNPGPFVEWPGLTINGGSFDGANHTISGIIVNKPDSDYQGFITATTVNANWNNLFKGEVKNLNIVDSYIVGKNEVGGICGNDYKGLVSNCSFEGTVIGNQYVGGICGRVQARNYIVENCTNKGKVIGTKCVGGIVGYADCLIKIEKCVNEGNISGSEGSEYIGGIAGNSKQSLVKECWNKGEISGTNYVAGVVGYEHDTSSLGPGIRNCYNIGKVSGDDFVAGIAAFVEEVEYCYNIGEVTGNTHVYGVGTYSASKVSNCYYDSTICTRDDSNYYYATKLDTSAFTSGEVAFKLRGNGENCWGQNLDDTNRTIDDYPILSNGAPQLAVYYGQDNGNDKYHNHLSDTCQYCPFNPVNPDLVDGKYVIDTPNKLYWFACYVNGKTVTNSAHPNASAVLADNITVNPNVLTSIGSPNLSAWVPIGDDSNKFTGSFDGQGHTISGLYFNNDTADYVGLFGAIGSGGSVSNVGIVDSYFNGNDYVGAIAGKNVGTISGCFSTSSKVVAGTNYGGICGIGDSNVNNSFYNITVSDASDSSLSTDSNAFTSGKVTYLLNGDQTKLVWGQLLGGAQPDTVPQRISDDKSNRVYKGIVDPIYHNHASDINYCSICKTYMPKEPDKSGDIYQISDVNELFGFAALVNGTLDGVAADQGARGVLTANITVNENLFDENGDLVTANIKSYWVPIGNETNKFTGSFDGNGYKISGLYFNSNTTSYAGLFGAIGEGGKVSNIGVVDSYFKGNDYVGAIAGKNDGTINGCFSTSTIEASTENKGGISGSGTVTNSCYLNTGVTNAVDEACAKYSAAFAGGEVAYLLNGDQSSLVWGQLLGGAQPDTVPQRISADNSNRVYKGIVDPFYHNHNSSDEKCLICKAYLPKEPESADGCYRISNARELYWFAGFVNGTLEDAAADSMARGILTADITVNETLFDENGDPLNDIVYWTPIGTDTRPFVGEFIGDGHTISGLYLSDENADYAGLFGYIGEDGSVSNVGVVDSYFKGKNAGGIAGKNEGTINGCFSTSTVVGSTGAGGISGSGSGTVTNSCYLNTGVTNAVDEACAKDSAAFAGGEVAYLLNGDQSNRVWGQFVENNTLPVPRTIPNTVYLGVDGIYHNHTESMITCEHCSTVIPVTPGQVGGVYQITSAGELYGFAEIVNGSSERAAESGAKAILKNDITLNADPDLGKVNWTPIGSSSKPFTGSFDGNGYTISGLYFENNTASNIGLIGYAGSSAQISGVCVSNAAFSGDEYVGAVCGYNNGGSISECCSIGNQISGKYAGGISGYNSGTVKNCYNTGEVSGTQAGGIVGLNNGSGNVQYCINIVSISGTDCKPVCASTGNVTNCFYNEDFSSCTGGAGTAISTYALTGDNFLGIGGFDTSVWEKKSNDSAYLYYPSLKNIIADEIKVGYTARFVLENTTSEPIVYGDDLSFTFDAVLDLDGKDDPVSVTSSINPLELAQMDFAIDHNGEPLDAAISYTVDVINAKLIIKMDDRDAGSIAFDSESGKIIVIITEDLNAEENAVTMTYNGTAVPLFNGVGVSCAVDIGRAIPVISLPDATGVDYGQPLSASTLSNTDWSWIDGTVIPTVTNPGYNAVISVDDENYNFDDVEGYDRAAHTLTKSIPVTVAAAVPTIVVMADTKAIPDSKVTISAVVSNPNNSTLTDLPAVSGYTYRVGDGAEKAITNSSFVIPKNTPNNSTITITAKTSATDNYAVGTGTVTVLVTDCTHANKTLKYDANKHWYYCSYCGADINVSVHSGGTATCTSKAVCEVCEQEYGTVDSNNHTGVSSAWNFDGTGHWHICSACNTQVDKAAHKSSGPATAELAETCTICGYEITPKIGQVSAPVISPNGGSFTSSQEITITSRTDGAAIYYTLDGTAPTVKSTRYTGAFTLTESATVKAIAVKVGMSNSTVSQAVYTITSTPVDPVVETVAAPVFSPNGGSFTDSQEVTITCSTVGAAIYYTLDGTAPTVNSTKYTGAFTLTESATVKAIAIKSGMNNSTVSQEVYNITSTPVDPVVETVAAPVFSPNGGSFTGSQEVTIICATVGAAIYYTLDGTAPTVNSTKYTGAFTLTESATVKAIAIKSGMNNSTVSQEVYNITSTPVDPVVETVAAPVFSPNGGSFTDSQEVTITCATVGAAIYYTLDGTAPTVNSTKYTGAFTLTESATVMAIAVKSGMNNSSVAQAVYTITAKPVEKVAAPTFSPNGGSFTDSQKVTITCATEGADIYYTTDGTTPTTSGIKYTGAFTISSTATIKAIAVSTGMENSDIVSVTFTRKSSGGSIGGGGGGNRPTKPAKNEPSIGGTSMSWTNIAAELSKLVVGSEVTIDLNGITDVPAEVIRVIAERALKVTFVVDTVRSWKVNGSEITTPADADLSLIGTRKLNADGLRGVSGIQFTMNNTNIPTNLEIAFKSEHSGKFANLYKAVGDKLIFVTCARIGADGKAILPGVAEKGDYLAMLCEFSDLPGDMNNDGTLNALDASAILKDIVGLEKGANPIMADFNGDGIMNAMDASAVLKRIVGIA